MADIQQGAIQFYPNRIVAKDNGRYTIQAISPNAGFDWWVENDFKFDYGTILIEVNEKTDYDCTIIVDISGIDFSTDINEEIPLTVYQETNKEITYCNTVMLSIQVESNVPEVPDEPFIPTPDEPEEPEEPDTPTTETNELTADLKSVTFEWNSRETKVINIKSNKSVAYWGYSSHFYLNIETIALDEHKMNVVLSLKTKNDTENWIYSDITITASGFDKEPLGEITIPVVIKGQKVIPIWKDEYYQYSTPNECVTFKLKNTNTDDVVYSGKSVKYPNADNIEICINKLSKGLLSSNFKDFGNRFNIIDTYSVPLNLEIDDKVVATYIVYNSWCYTDESSKIFNSIPIRKVVDKRQYFMCTLYNANNNRVPVEYSYNNGRKDVKLQSFNTTYNYMWLICDQLDKYPNIKSITVGVIKYDVIDSCCDYCLYYTNSCGGWDSLLINGNSIMKDKIDSKYYSKTFKNTTVDFEKVKYHNLLTRSYVLYTDWFSDVEQSKLHNLLESTQVYLHNLNTNEIEPVNITNTTCEWKTFTNNGKKKFYNTINVEVAQQRIRE